LNPDHTDHESRITNHESQTTHHTSRFTYYVSRITYHVSRLEPLLILAIAPFLIFPSPGRAPWLLAVVPLLWLCRWVGRGRLTVRTPLDGPILLLLLMVVVGLGATFDLAVSFPKLCGVVLGVALFYALVNAVCSDTRIWLAALLLLTGGAAVAGIGLVGTRWGAGKVPVLLPFLTSLYGRVPLLLQGVPRAEQGFNANQVGGTLALFVPLVAALFLHRLTARRQRRAAMDLPPARRTLPLGIRDLLITVGLGGLTQSRLSYLAVALALLLVGTTLGRWPRLLAILVLLAGAGLVAYYGIDRVGQAIFGIGSLEALTDDASWVGRVEIWRRALRVIRDHPLTGVGFDALFPVIHARYPTFYHVAGHSLAHAHNVFLQVALDLGLPGLAAFAWLLVAFGRMTWQVWRGSVFPAFRALAIGLFVGLLAQLIFGLGDAIALGQKPGIFLWAYLGLGAALWLRECQIANCKLQTANRKSQIPNHGSRITDHGSRIADHASRNWRSLLALLLLLSTVAWTYGRVARARGWLSLIESDVAALQSLAWEGPRASAPWSPRELVHVMRSDLLGVQSEFALPLALAPHLGWVPGYGADVQAAPVLLQMGLDLAALGEQVLEPFDPLLAAPGEGGGGSLEEGDLLIKTLQDARPQLAQALATLEGVRQARRTIDTERLSPRMGQWVAKFDRLLPSLERGIGGALALPELLGASEPRTYLILVQNDDELRPTGGFISGVARVVFNRGRVVELVFEDSYAVDDLSRPYPAAPAPLNRIMGTDLWFLRDSNWSPDFPSAAQVAMVLYWLRYDDVTVDGVLALDQHALQLLVAALQPLEVEEYSESITSENLIQAVRESWAPSEEGPTEEWKQRRKDFMGRLLAAVVRKFQDQPGRADLAALGWATLRALEQRHMFVYLPERGPEVIHQAGWDGRVLDVPGDYLMVVDANVGFNKVGPYVTESLSYAVDLRDVSSPRAELALVHRHEGPNTGMPCRHGSRPEPTYEQMMQRCYWDYVRVYVPRGSRLLDATSHPIPGSLLLRGEEWPGQADVLPNELGKTVFASFLVMAPQEQTETRFVYELPPGIVERDGDAWRYGLTIQKQGGTGGNEVLVTLHLPPESELTAVHPPPARRDGDTLLYNLELYTDVELAVAWK
jgi:O-antigen ligase